ncbi:YneF family protein [Spiroplasma endosymbiont of Diplazon laetatorius]|uniref:YneF family protein n=1 Tax=Spiroplasma endosymbiont of Diplazon laetatorius TaxID=3066322 RepID=UPI0030CA789A
MIAWWGALLIAIGAAIVGGIIGFIITRKVIQKQLRDNPPINENQIRAMYRSMGRKPTEADIKKTMNAVKRGK